MAGDLGLAPLAPIDLRPSRLPDPPT